MAGNRYTPYSPRTRKALEAIGDIKMILSRRREQRKKLHAGLIIAGDQQRILSPHLPSPSTGDRFGSSDELAGSNGTGKAVSIRESPDFRHRN